jgi:hypothetical protein
VIICAAMPVPETGVPEWSPRCHLSDAGELGALGPLVAGAASSSGNNPRVGGDTARNVPGANGSSTNSALCGPSKRCSGGNAKAYFAICSPAAIRALSQSSGLFFQISMSSWAVFPKGHL